MKRLLILSCSARKSDAKACRAIDRYNSPAFYLVRKFLRENDYEKKPVIWIVSAEYGLISQHIKIANYNKVMTAEIAESKKRRFFEQFYQLFQFHFDTNVFEPETVPSEVFCHLPKLYQTAISNEISRLEKMTSVKVACGRPGEKLKQLKNWLEN